MYLGIKHIYKTPNKIIQVKYFLQRALIQLFSDIGAQEWRYLYYKCFAVVLNIRLKVYS